MTSKAVLDAHFQQVPAEAKHGVQWYKYLFTVDPLAKTFFKGAQNMTPEKVPESERFQKQGVRFLTRMHEVVNQADNEAGMRKIWADLFIHHKEKLKITDPALYEGIMKHWVNFLEQYVGLNEEQKQNWAKMIEICYDEAKKQLA